LCFEDISNILMNEEMHMKSMGEEMSNMEALTHGDYRRKPKRKKSRISISRGGSRYRHGRITYYHCGKPGHVIKYFRILKMEKRDQKEVNNNNNEETIVVALDGE
jgi:hypothetical protein